jgi:tetratricopeptide (TPR) repeat protein
VHKLKYISSKINLNNVLVISYDIKAAIYKELNDKHNFFLTIDKILDLPSDEIDSNLQVIIARATYIKAVRTDTTQTINNLKGLIQDFKEVNDKDVQDVIRRSVIRLIRIYNESKDFISAHRYCDYLIENSDTLGEIAEPHGLLLKLKAYKLEEKKHEAALILQKFESKFSETTNEDIQELLIYAILINSEGNNDSHNSFVSENKIIELFRDSKSKKVQKHVAEAYSKRAIDYYGRGDVLTAANDFVKAFKSEHTIAGNNIFYMIRRNEIQQNMIPYTMEELITPKLNEKDPYALINQALYLIQNDKKWIEADKLISKIEKTSEELEGVISWWYKLSVKGDKEGDLVLAWLIRYKLIKDPDNLSIRDRLERVKQWNIPDFMFDYASEISSLRKQDI